MLSIPATEDLQELEADIPDALIAPRGLRWCENVGSWLLWTVLPGALPIVIALLVPRFLIEATPLYYEIALATYALSISIALSNTNYFTGYMVHPFNIWQRWFFGLSSCGTILLVSMIAVDTFRRLSPGGNIDQQALINTSLYIAPIAFLLGVFGHIVRVKSLERYYCEWRKHQDQNTRFLALIKEKQDENTRLAAQADHVDDIKL